MLLRQQYLLCSTLLNKLNVGQAIISLPQTVEVCRVSIISKKDNTSAFNLGCIYCDIDDCGNNRGILTPDEEQLAQEYGFNVNTYANCIKQIEERQGIDLSIYERLCLIGRLISKHVENKYIARQSLYDYWEFLKRNESD